MALETGTYIDSLNVSNPAATDALSQADEHLRLLKATIKATFPNVTGAVTATQGALNSTAAITTDGTAPSLATGATAAQIKTLIGITDSAPAITTDGSTPSLASGISAAEVVTLLGVSLLNVYPVGSVYSSVVATSPATHFGGTWAAFGAGKVLVGVDPSDTAFNAVEETGGSKTHTLTVAEIPSHTHAFTAMQDTTDSVNRTGGGDLGSPTSSTTAGTGGGSAHNIMQPYVTVYMWKRTA